MNTKALTIIALMGLALLSGCKEASTKLANVCPTLFPYSKEFQEKLAGEVDEAMSRYPAIIKVIEDNGVTRQQIRVCLKAVQIPQGASPGLFNGLLKGEVR